MIELRLDDVRVAHGRVPILHGISTPPLRGGEVVAVIGPNAAGKSTLMRRIAGLVGGAGTVSLTGTSRVAGRRAPSCCYMPQDGAVAAALSVYEAVLLALKQGASWGVTDADLGRVERVLDDLRLTDLGFRSMARLSGGQRQLVSLAETLVREPDLALLDEPTSALDLSRQIEILDHVRNVARQRGTCVLISIHDLNQALRIADTVLVLDGGRLVALGPPAAVITPALLRTVYGVEARMEAAGSAGLHVLVDGLSGLRKDPGGAGAATAIAAP